MHALRGLLRSPSAMGQAPNPKPLRGKTRIQHGKELRPLAIFHHQIQIIKRSRGRSAVEAAAYRSGTKLTNEWDGRTHDYTRKRGIVHTEIFLPTNAPPEFMDRETLWSSVEMAEKSGDAQLAREIEVSLPVELNREEQLKLVREFIQKTFVDKGMCADLAVHDKGDGNPHAHIMLTLRPLNPDGTWGAKCRKVYDLDADGNKIPNGKGGWKSHRENTTDWNDRGKAEEWRSAWAGFLNQALEANGIAARVDHRSYKRQGVDKIPSIHMGPAAVRMEKRGIRTFKGDTNRQIDADNKLLKQLKARITRLYNWSKEIQAREKELKGPQKQSIMAQIMSAQLDRMQGKAAKFNYKYGNSLQESAKVLNLMLDYNVDSIEELFDAIKELNSDYYELRGRIRQTERRIDALRERLAKLETYTQYKALRQKINSMNPKKRALYETKYQIELAAFASAESYLRELKNSGEKISMKDWQKELKRLEEEQYAQGCEMKKMQERIKTAENIRKDMELAEQQYRQEEERRRDLSL